MAHIRMNDYNGAGTIYIIKDGVIQFPYTIGSGYYSSTNRDNFTIRSIDGTVGTTIGNYFNLSHTTVSRIYNQMKYYKNMGLHIGIKFNTPIDITKYTKLYVECEANANMAAPAFTGYTFIGYNMDFGTTTSVERSGNWPSGTTQYYAVSGIAETGLVHLPHNIYSINLTGNTMNTLGVGGFMYWHDGSISVGHSDNKYTNGKIYNAWLAKK